MTTDTTRDACHVCGEPADLVVEDSDDASGYKGDVAFCRACYAKREQRYGRPE
jgi:hypothetical protein